MSTKYILIVLGEPYSTFSEIIGKYFSKRKFNKRKIIIIGNFNLLKKQLIKLNFKLKINKIKNLEYSKRNNLNVIDIKYSNNKIFSEITSKSNSYIKESFKKSLDIIQTTGSDTILINGPISKKTFLKKKYLGITEYLSEKTKSNKGVMLIYNNKLAVSPITTHIPIKDVTKNLNKKKIINSVTIIQNFYKNILNKTAKFAVLGLNPHCETVDNFSEENKILKPCIKSLKKRGINIDGPYPADTFFLKKNIEKFDVVIGMYHDQVLTPIKTLFKFKAINVTLGLPFIRISPDHGPNNAMLGKNISDPSSFFYAMEFINKLK